VKALCPHPGWFLAKSAESLGNKRVEFFLGAKKCKRVRKNVKRKWIARKHVETSEGPDIRKPKKCSYPPLPVFVKD